MGLLALKIEFPRPNWPQSPLPTTRTWPCLCLRPGLMGDGVVESITLLLQSNMILYTRKPNNIHIFQKYSKTRYYTTIAFIALAALVNPIISFLLLPLLLVSTNHTVTIFNNVGIQVNNLFIPRFKINNVFINEAISCCSFRYYLCIDVGTELIVLFSNVDVNDLVLIYNLSRDLGYD